MTGLWDDSTIITSRLVLRPLRVEDAEEMVGVLGDPAMHEFIGGRPATLPELRDRYASWVEGSGSADELWLNWIACRRTDGVAVGAMQATVMSPGADAVADIVWTIGTDWQRQGYAAEAALGLVHWLTGQGVESVVAHVHPEHAASAGVASRAGLRPTTEMVDGEVVWHLG